MTDTPGFGRPASKKTPVMTVPEILTWFDLEIGDIKARHDATDNEYARTVMQGIWLVLEKMSAQLADYSMRMLDEK